MMTPTVFIVDDDDAVRDALQQMLELAGLRVETYADGLSFLAECHDGHRGCLVLDMAMPGLNGHSVQAELNKRGIRLPIIFLSGHGRVPDAVRALQGGAMDFLEKPVQSARLLERVQHAFTVDAQNRRESLKIKEVHDRYAGLSTREREVMTLVINGLSNKEIARELNLSPRTIEVHRQHVMYKMGADSLAQLIKMGLECPTGMNSTT